MTDFDYDDWFDDVLRAIDGLAAHADEIGQELGARQESFRAELCDMLGFPAVRNNVAEDIDLRRREYPEATARHRSYERQMWSVHIERGLRAPFCLLLPGLVDPPYPVAATLHGHTEYGKDLVAGAAEGEVAGRHIADDRRDMARQAIRRGFVIVALNMCAFGEPSPDTSDDSDSSDAVSTCTRWQKCVQLLDRSLVDECVWDVRRLVDFVEGHSAPDDRIGYVVACASVCPFEDSIVPIDHCLRNYVPGLRCLGEARDVIGLVAPRSFHIVAGGSDPIFPIAGARRAFDRIQDRYRVADAERKCSLFVGDGSHRFFETGAWPFLRDRL